MTIFKFLQLNSTSIIVAIGLSIIVFRLCTNLAGKIGLVDKPNARKVHITATPVIGGLVIGLVCSALLLLRSTLYSPSTPVISIIIGGFVLLTVGVLDDRFDIKAIIKLVIQVGVAAAVIFYGTYLQSFYGILGIYALPPTIAKIITLVLIVGVVNAFNLIDGIDGLAGLFSLVGLIVIGAIAINQKEFFIAYTCLIIVAAVIVFLFHNLGRNKVFLGDGGSLFIGFLLVSFGLKLIGNEPSQIAETGFSRVAAVLGIFILPVLDSVRVYWGRITSGYSPFRADKSHMHHLVIGLNISHKVASFIIVLSALTCMLLVGYGLAFINFTAILLLVILILMTISQILLAIHRLNEWQIRIKNLEYRD